MIFLLLVYFKLQNGNCIFWFIICLQNSKKIQLVAVRKLAQCQRCSWGVFIVKRLLVAGFTVVQSRMSVQERR